MSLVDIKVHNKLLIYIRPNFALDFYKVVLILCQEGGVLLNDCPRFSVGLHVTSL